MQVMLTMMYLYSVWLSIKDFLFWKKNDYVTCVLFLPHKIEKPQSTAESNRRGIPAKLLLVCTGDYDSHLKSTLIFFIKTHIVNGPKVWHFWYPWDDVLLMRTVVSLQYFEIPSSFNLIIQLNIHKASPSSCPPFIITD